MNVLGRLLTHDVDHVIVGDDAQHVVLFVDHRNGVQVELGDLLRHLLLIVRHVDRDQLAVHQFVKQQVGLAQRRHQLSGRNQPAQMVLVVDDVNVVDRLQFFRLFGHVIQRLLDRQAFRQTGKLRGHHGAGGPFRIGPQAQDVAPIERRNERQQPLDHFRIDRLENVDAIVGRQFADQLADFGPIAGLDDFDLLVAVQIAENLGPGRWVGLLQNGPGFGRGEPFHELGGPGRMQSDRELAHFFEIVVGKHFPQLGQVECIGHRCGLRQVVIRLSPSVAVHP